MQNIAIPKKINFIQGKTSNEGVIVIEPLFPGYGMTLGNSLRRVLLSSLPGAAVIAVKIKGASHEFMTIPGVKEDVLELLLNFKQLRFKMFTEDEVRLELKVSGKKVVTAADISKDSQVEIKNTDLILADLTDPKAELDVEILVRSGRGYQMAEANKKENKEVDFLEIDSIFSPVSLVSIKVEDTRVGKMTNWDKLLLDVKTDGTITPEEAFQEAVKILVEQFSALLPDGPIYQPKEEVILEKEESESSPEEEVEESEKEEKKEDEKTKTKKKTNTKTEKKTSKKVSSKDEAKASKKISSKEEAKTSKTSKTKK